MIKLQSEAYEYEVRNGKAYILRYIGNESLIRVPAQLNKIPVEGISPAAFRGNESVVEVELARGILFVGEEAFADCKKLITVRFPSCVKRIGRGCFDGCGWLNKLEIPFVGVSALAVGFEATLAALFGERTMSTGIGLKTDEHGDMRTYSLPKLSSVTITTQENIPANAFNGWSQLEKIAFGSAVTLGENACKGCTSLKKVVFANGLQTLGNSAFSGCTALAEADLPGTLWSLGENCFFGCVALKHLYLKRGITGIGSRCFAESGLTSVVLPNTLTTLGARAFQKCVALRVARFEKKLGYLVFGENVFEKSALASLTISMDSYKIYAQTFRGCRLEELIVEGNDGDPISVVMHNCEKTVRRIYVDELYLAEYRANNPDWAQLISVKPTGFDPMLEFDEVDVTLPKFT